MRPFWGHFAAIFALLLQPAIPTNDCDNHMPLSSALSQAPLPPGYEPAGRSHPSPAKRTIVWVMRAGGFNRARSQATQQPSERWVQWQVSKVLLGQELVALEEFFKSWLLAPTYCEGKKRKLYESLRRQRQAGAGRDTAQNRRSWRHSFAC